MLITQCYKHWRNYSETLIKTKGSIAKSHNKLENLWACQKPHTLLRINIARYKGMDDVQSSTVVATILSPQKKKLTSEKTCEHQKGVRDYCFSPGSVRLLYQCLGRYVSVIYLNVKYLKGPI